MSQGFSRWKETVYHGKVVHPPKKRKDGGASRKGLPCEIWEIEGK